MRKNDGKESLINECCVAIGASCLITGIALLGCSSTALQFSISKREPEVPVHLVLVHTGNILTFLGVSTFTVVISYFKYVYLEKYSVVEKVIVNCDHS